MVTLSQDLVSYEPGLLKQYDWSYEKIRNYLILYLQNACFRHSSGVIFLTEYAKQKILRSCGNISRTAIIPHGVDDDFHQLANVPNCNKYVSGSEVKCIYVSPVFKYKNHVNVTRAIANLRKNGINVVISFIGGSGDTEDELKSELICLDPEGTFVTRHGQVPYSTLPDLLTESDLFIFASECEAFGITLLEGMCASLPIACSNKSSLPETLQDGGIYFDPKNVDSIANAIELLIKNPIICSEKTVRAKELSKHYTWSRCSDSTFRFINDVYESVNEMRVVDEL